MFGLHCQSESTPAILGFPGHRAAPAPGEEMGHYLPLLRAAVNAAVGLTDAFEEQE